MITTPQTRQLTTQKGMTKVITTQQASAKKVDGTTVLHTRRA